MPRGDAPEPRAGGRGGRIALQRHDLRYTSKWAVGSPGVEIVKVAKKEKAHMIVMGTHGHGILGRALLGSVAQNVLTTCEIPVLLVK